jgi:hypothetical protein
MAVQSKNPGKNPTAGAIRTPAPSAPDAISAPRHPTPAGYGQNGPQPSSVAPGKSVLSPLGANMKATVDDDGALDTVMARGTARSQTLVDDKQLREIAAGNVPIHAGTRGAAVGSKVPARLGQNESPLPKV